MFNIKTPHSEAYIILQHTFNEILEMIMLLQFVPFLDLIINFEYSYKSSSFLHHLNKIQLC